MTAIAAILLALLFGWFAIRPTTTPQGNSQQATTSDEQPPPDKPPGTEN